MAFSFNRLQNIFDPRRFQQGGRAPLPMEDEGPDPYPDQPDFGPGSEGWVDIKRTRPRQYGPTPPPSRPPVKNKTESGSKPPSMSPFQSSHREKPKTTSLFPEESTFAPPRLDVFSPNNTVLPFPPKTVRHGNAEYDPSITYPSPMGYDYTDPEIRSPGDRPSFPRSPQSRFMGGQSTKPMRSSPEFSEADLYPPAEEEPGVGFEQGFGPAPKRDRSLGPIPSVTQPSPSAQPSPTTQPNMISGSPTPQPYAGLDYQPETEMNRRLQALLDSMPQRDQDMSKWRKFGSFLVGAGLGPEVQEKVTYAPFYRELADWKMKLDPTMKGAELERQENVNRRQLAYNESQARTAEGRLRVQENRFELDKAKLRAKEYRDKNPDAKLVKADDGYYHFLHQDGRDVRTDAKHTEMSDFDQMMFERENIEIRGQVQRANQAVEDTNDWHYYLDYPRDGSPPIQKAERKRADGTWETRNVGVGSQGQPTQPTGTNTQPSTQVPAQQPTQLPDEGARGRPRSPAQDKDAVINRANALISRNPKLKSIIKFDNVTKMPVIKSKPLWSSLTQKDIDDANNYIWGTEGIPQSTQQGGTQGTTSSGNTWQVID